MTLTTKSVEFSGRLKIAYLHDNEDGVLTLSNDTACAFELKEGDFVLAEGRETHRTILKVRLDGGKTNNELSAYISRSSCRTLGARAGDEISLSSVRGVKEIDKIAVCALDTDVKNVSSDQSMFNILAPYLSKRSNICTGERFIVFHTVPSIRFMVKEIEIEGAPAEYGIITAETSIHCGRAYTETA
ncbi:hypothetical protein FOXG_14299 [Fusarium oxysporum f. sp. lycopersici 4287]|uniref:Uncharacterized protein n=1 Tax=Fusarium oxysporum f. sp. lycopersici (strain 4287 / CBS 123668 / FGSC 9935 / NRRL 34936) TaxID=426428 RepID=A0A0J9WTG5_FUSO4|nr:hypothetical protein FOXG_14299 [Fusarium oxysporum f. sp. lycopersici 4287]EWZ78225.1 hypothetical protein FOWG_17461 [Fusarium oxysporum f. sp. lycopersici MN25]KAJ9413692.1 hypothetical protein QL093DRAFT_2123081 [Fusarium oxysporum]KNB15992.1 hypothetical protein FOXG_14299 [Fusarium oxysporum f. sp. lycopersici 4287]